MTKAFRNKTILQILDKYKDIWALSYASSVAHWDLETYMPQKGAAARGEALGRLSVIRQRLFLDKDFVESIHRSENENNLTDQEKGIVRILLRTLKFYEKLPPKFIEDFEKLTNTATMVWREAKEEKKFDIFAPYLIQIFRLNRQMAEYLGYEDSPYDALLDQFEEGLTGRTVDKFFDEIKQPLKDLLSGIVGSENYSKTHPLENAKYDTGRMEALNTKILKLFWNDPQRFRLDVSTHPFTTSFSNNDTRITTWYHDRDFARSLLATIHEFGHALYDLQSAPGLEMTPIAGGSSLVIHESQSRFWENFIGRSKPFIKKFEKEMGELGNVQGTSLYRYLNKVAPGALRVEADEVTYHFHIMLRYEIEKGMIEGKIRDRDLREAWNGKMKEYLGVTPKNDSEGVLQDIHWSGGAVGYFPTYSLGTFLAAQWAEKIKNEELIINNYKGVGNWLREHIHKYGSTYTLQDLLKKNGMKFDPDLIGIDPQVNLKYLSEKYSKIYNVALK